MNGLFKVEVVFRPNKEVLDSFICYKEEDARNQMEVLKEIYGEDSFFHEQVDFNFSKKVGNKYVAASN